MKSFNIYRTRWGNGAVVFGRLGLSGVLFPHESDTGLDEEVTRMFGGCVYDKTLGNDLCSTLGRYIDGEEEHFDIQVDLSRATKFERLVYSRLKGIPYGECITYRNLAELCGCPGAARAVGNALAKNPFPIIVPCHRVLKSDGRIGGWSGKPGWKERLLAIEGILPGYEIQVN